MNTHGPHWRSDDLDEKNLDAARYYDYSNCLWLDPNGKNTPDMKDQHYTPDQYQEWARIHPHCGSMTQDTRARIMRQMQKDARIKPENFHAYVTEQDNYFHRKYSRHTRHSRVQDHTWHRDRLTPDHDRFNRSNLHMK